MESEVQIEGLEVPQQDTDRDQRDEHGGVVLELRAEQDMSDRTSQHHHADRGWQADGQQRGQADLELGPGARGPLLLERANGQRKCGQIDDHQQQSEREAGQVVGDRIASDGSPVQQPADDEPVQAVDHEAQGAGHRERPAVKAELGHEGPVALSQAEILQPFGQGPAKHDQHAPDEAEDKAERPQTQPHQDDPERQRQGRTANRHQAVSLGPQLAPRPLELEVEQPLNPEQRDAGQQELARVRIVGQHPSQDAERRRETDQSEERRGDGRVQDLRPIFAGQPKAQQGEPQPLEGQLVAQADPGDDQRVAAVLVSPEQPGVDGDRGQAEESGDTPSEQI